MNIKANKISAIILIVIAIAISFIAGKNFMEQRQVPEVKAGPGVTEVKMLSEYFDGLKDTAMDTPIYVMEGKEPGGKYLILGGTHPNEPAGYMSAIVMIQNAMVEKGTVYVIPYTNRSAMSHNDPQEGAPQKINFPTKDGKIVTYNYGSRATNPLDQWPDPDVYTHAASGQTLSGSETRNINRAYPGRPDGNITEKAAYAIAELIRQEKIDLEVDLHEASPEYPVINATVAHERAMPVAAGGVINLQMQGIAMALEPSPVNLHGLTHRELGDYTETLALLMETSNPSQGRIRGATNEDLALKGKDKAYLKASELKFLFVPYDEKGHPIELRVGRHLQGIKEHLASYNNLYSDRQIEYTGVPTYEELFLNANEDELGGKKLGEYLLSNE